jgi:glyoxylase-like metal-dependent hydrolase (beta-lactamase superfamily II)
VADFRKKLPGNTSGLFFVDNTCIDCDTCRQLAPENFTEDESNFAVVYKQPESQIQIRNSTHALLACPTGSIGTTEKIDTHSAMDDFPLLVDDGIYYNGFTSKNSFGASSYLIKHPEGNWMTDAPKYMPNLVKKFEEMGGVTTIFLTHQDDVADAQRYAEHFGAKRIIHRHELHSQPGAEIVLDGEEPQRFGDDFLIIPTPGHTRGHCVLLYKGHYLFSGDHMWWSRKRNRLWAGRDVTWYSWEEEIRSMKKLRAYDFDWVIPGHGQRIHLSKDEMMKQLGDLIENMQKDGNSFY